MRDAIGAPADMPLIVADASDPASLKAMVDQTRSVMTTVGPYQLYGNELIAVCAATGTDYLDLCGEPIWMRRMIDAARGGREAERRADRVLVRLRFAAVRTRRVLRCQEAAKKAFGAPVARVKGRVRAMKGTFSGGTAASVKAIFDAAAKDPSLLAMVRDPFALTPGFDGPKQPPGNRPLFDEDLRPGWRRSSWRTSTRATCIAPTCCWVSRTARISSTTRC